MPLNLAGFHSHLRKIFLSLRLYTNECAPTADISARFQIGNEVHSRPRFSIVVGHKTLIKPANNVTIQAKANKKCLIEWNG